VERRKALDTCGVSRQKSASEAPCGACLPQSAWFVSLVESLAWFLHVFSCSRAGCVLARVRAVAAPQRGSRLAAIDRMYPDTQLLY